LVNKTEEQKMTANEKTAVGTKAGKIQGRLENGLYIFRGIPFAASTSDDRRWLPPQSVTPWKGIRSALEFGNIAPQGADNLKVMPEFQKTEMQSEDCLFLNIWSPGLDDARRPVMVWIHGGAFNVGSGSSPMYSGETLAKRGNIVFVSINYRLGPLGFLHLKTLPGSKIPASGNEGLLDQIAALKWVRENIAAFGGDSENVTIFGESAGAMCIGCLMAMPEAEGLFHKAILQSGANTVISLEQSRQYGNHFVDALEVNIADAESLRALPLERVILAQDKMSEKTGIKGALLRPVVDGEVLLDMPIESVKKGSASRVKVMAGTNLDEVKLFARIGASPSKLDEAGLIRRCQRMLPPELVPELIAGYRSARTKAGISTEPVEMLAAIHSDLQFRIPELRLIEGQSLFQLVYNYLFTFKSPLPALGACHALDIGFVFGNLSQALMVRALL
jgi:para-nitrobenzyl esterase